MPPATPVDGSNWLVASAGTGDWAGHDGAIACRQAGSWLFVEPRDGMRVLDRSSGQELRYAGGWIVPTAPEEPAGGSVIDAEARMAIAGLIAALRVAGIFPAS